MEFLIKITSGTPVSTAFWGLLFIGGLTSLIDLTGIVLTAEIISSYLGSSSGSSTGSLLLSRFSASLPFGNADSESLIPLAIAVVGAAYLLKGLVLIAENHLAQAVRRRIISGLMSKFLFSGIDEVGKLSAEALINLIVPRVNFVVANLVRPFLRVVLTLVTGSIIFAGLIIIEPKVGYAVVVIAAVMLGIYVVLKMPTKIAGERADATTKALIERVATLKLNARQIKAKSLEHVLHKRNNESLRRLAGAFAAVQITKQAPKLLLEGLFALSLLLVLHFSTRTASSAPETDAILPVLIACLLGLQRLMPSVGAVSQFLSGRITCSVPLSEIRAFWPNTDFTSLGDVVDNGSTVDIQKIEITDLSFSYDGAESKTILCNLNYSFNVGDFVYVEGKSGAGKTTLLDLILKIREPSSGSVSYVDARGKRLTRRLDSSLVEVISADEQLFGTSLVEYLTYFWSKQDGDLCDFDIKQALIALDLPGHLLESQVQGVWHHGLSTGQQQRVKLLRLALGQRRKLIVLDEALSNLDRQRQALICEQLRPVLSSAITFVTSHDPHIDSLTNQTISLNSIYDSSSE